MDHLELDYFCAVKVNPVLKYLNLGDKVYSSVIIDPTQSDVNLGATFHSLIQDVTHTTVLGLVCIVLFSCLGLYM